MTLPGLKTSYDQSIVPSRYTLTNLTGSTYCVSATHGTQSWKKDGPGAVIQPGACS
jgi:hypothetical protein